MSYKLNNTIVIDDTSNITGNSIAANSITITGNTILKTYTETYSNNAISAGTVTFNLTNATVFPVVVNSNITTMNITNPGASANQVSSFVVVFNYTGTAYAVAWNSAIRWPGGSSPILTNTAGKRDIFTLFTYDGGTSYNAFISGQNL